MSDLDRALRLLKYLNENRSLGAKSVDPAVLARPIPRPPRSATCGCCPPESVRRYAADADNRPDDYAGIALSAGSDRKAVDSNNGRWSASFTGGTEEAADWGGGGFVSDGETLWGIKSFRGNLSDLWIQEVNRDTGAFEGRAHAERSRQRDQDALA